MSLVCGEMYCNMYSTYFVVSDALNQVLEAPPPKLDDSAHSEEGVAMPTGSQSCSPIRPMPSGDIASFLGRGGPYVSGRFIRVVFCVSCTPHWKVL